MEDIKDKIKAAKKEGFTDVQIVDFLAKLPDVGPQVTTALESQYKPAEILKFLGQSPAYREGTQRSTTQRGIVTALQGPTFGFLDELAGAVTAPFTAMQQNIPLGQAYQQGRDIVRGQTESFEAERPFTAAGLQLAASGPMALLKAPATIGRAVMPSITAAAPSIAPTVQAAGRYLAAAPATGQVMGLGQRTAQAAASGAGYGLLSGTGASTSDNPLDVLSDAATSAVFGSALGAATQPVQSILGAGSRQVMARVSPTSAATQAQQKVAEALIRDQPEALASSALNRAQTRLTRLGPEARIADVGGKSTRNLLDVQATLPGTTTEAVERAIRERQSGRAGRLMTSADEALGTQGAQYLAKLEDFSNQRFIESRPYYAAVDKATAKVDAAVADVLNKSQAVQRDAELLFKTKTGQTIDLSQLQPGQTVPMNVLDSLKQSLYDASQSLRRSGSNEQANAYDQVRLKLIGELEKQSPKVGGQSAYTMALKTWAGPSQMMDAAEVGRSVMRGDILDVQQATKGLSPSEIDAFRIGALQALRQSTGTESGQTSLLKMWKEPATQERLKAAFGNDYRTFAAAVAKEARLKGLESTGRGSQTAARLAGTADLDIAPLGQTLAAASTGSPTGIIAAATNLANQTRTPEAVRNEIGRILLSRDPQELRKLEAIVRQVNASRSRAAGVSGFGAGQIGSIISDNPMP
jgi:hypothetical protein